MGNGPLLEMTGISKVFPGVKALDKVDLAVDSGEILGLVGENGAGKSTIIKIIMGVHERTEGIVKLDGKEINLNNVIEAEKLGLAAVYQDLNLAPDLSIGENFFLGQFPKTKHNLIDWNKVYEETSKTLKSLNINIDPRLKITEISPAMQEMVTIAKTVNRPKKLIIFDEPSALLSNEEIEILFKIIRKLKAQNLAIIYISHRIEEIFRICDKVAVLKDGKSVGTLSVKDTNEDKLITMMVGRSMSDMYDIEHHGKKEVALEVSHFNRGKVIKDTSFNVKKGEIFGLFGLVGSGRSELVRAIFGADPIDSGDLKIYGNSVKVNSPAEAIANGIGFIPEDRKELGMASNLSIVHNLNLASYRMISKWGMVVNSSKEKLVSESMVDKLNIKTPSVRQLMSNLSGGNQQKVIIGKWLACKSKIFIFDEPTVGIDVGAKKEIYLLIQELCKEGHSVILISSYLPEVMGLADRIGVIHEGEMTGILERKEFTEENLLRYASGLVKKEIN
jgi:ribose transport system ATP-binding protein